MIDSLGEDLLRPYELDESGRPSPTPLARTTLAIPWRSDPFRESLSRLRKFARARQPILVGGESGVGKTSFAEIAHCAGKSPGEPFVVVNCAALPEPLLESELFGHVRGAFTGAETEKIGLIRSARSGTVFLDEIDKASKSLQAAMLHVLDRREVRSVGSHTTHRVQARFVFASNRDLFPLSAAGEFLPDLAYRIAGMSVRIPPLRRRPEDLDLLLALALRELRLEEGMAGLTLAPEVRDLVSTYDWPGNLRELFSVVRAAAHLLERGTRIGPAEIERAAAASRLEAHVHRVRARTDLASRVRAFEKEEILLALRVEGGNQTRAARRLGLSRRGLNKKLHRHELLDQLEREGLRGFRRRVPAGRAGETGVRFPAPGRAEVPPPSTPRSAAWKSE